MTGMELMTARQFNIGVKVLILNNEFQGMVKQWQDLFYEERYSGTVMKNPDFVKFAEVPFLFSFLFLYFCFNSNNNNFFFLFLVNGM